jgi:serine/threonine-protein kinase
MVAGRPPFVAEGAGELMAAHLMTVAPRVRSVAPEVSEIVEGVIARLLEKRPEDRYASADELLLALGGSPQDAQGRPVALVTPAMLTPVPSMAPTTLGGAAGESTKTRAPRRSRWIAIAGVVAAAGIAAGVVIGSSPSPSTSPSRSTGFGASTSMSTSTPKAPVEVTPPPAPVIVQVPAPPPPIEVAAPVEAPAPPPVPVKATHHHVAKKKPIDSNPNPPTQPARPTLPSELPPEL